MSTIKIQINEEGFTIYEEISEITEEQYKVLEKLKVFSFDAETDGLWGRAFAIGALVYDERGNEAARFVGRLPDSAVTNEWVRQNVLPQVTGIPVTHEKYGELLADFAKFYLANKEGSDIVVHMGYIVEARIIRDMYERGLIGEWDGPYPLHDVSGNLQAAGADPVSVDRFAADHGIEIAEFDGGTHNPLYDSAITAAVYRYLVGGRKNEKEKVA